LGVASGNITLSGNRLNYCVIFIVHAQFRNVDAGRLIHHGRPQFGDPRSESFLACDAAYFGGYEGVLISP